MAKSTSVHHNVSKIHHDSWCDIVLNSQIHLDHINQTYDILYMVERTNIASNAVAKFYYGSKMDSLNVVKPVAYQDILQNINEFSETPLSGHRTVEHLYNLAANESVTYLKNHEIIPKHWMAALIKLHIMYLLDKDVLSVYQDIVHTNDIEETQTLLLVGEKISKIKIDPCKLGNAYTFRTTSTLKSSFRKSLTGQEKIDVPAKHMLFVIIGFYDFELLKELFSSNMSLSCFIELVEADMVQTENDNNKTVENGVFENSTTIKKQVLKNFWNEFRISFEAEDYLDCFDNTFHMMIRPTKDSFKSEHTDEQLCSDVFTNICTDILKLLDIQRLHSNYIRNMKICEVNSDPKCATVKSYSIYRNILNLLPPECVNVPIITGAMLDQLDKGTVSDVNENSTDRNNNASLDISRYHYGIKSCIVDVLRQNLYFENAVGNTKDKTSSKIPLAITRNNFLVEINNDYYIKLSPYEEIRVEYLRRNQDLLEKCRSAMIWKEFRLPEEMNILTNRYHLQKLSNDLSIPTEELQYIIHVLLFMSITCSKSPSQRNVFLESILPPPEDTTPIVTEFIANIKMGTMPIPVDLHDELDEVVSNLVYSDNPNIYESKNMESYKWYEKLPIDIMMQELYKAEQFYLCLDYNYCAFDDVILLKFHNNLDDFGINRMSWHQSLRTYVGLREFCKYVIHEESQWLEKQVLKEEHNLRKEQENIVNLNEEAKQKVYPKLEFSDLDFVQPGSFKAKQMETLAVTKIHSKSHIKGSSKIKIVSEKSLLGKLTIAAELPSQKKLSIHSATSPYSFFAYDISKRRTHLTGSTITFYSQDGVIVTVDQTRFTRQADSMSINLKSDGHSLVVHSNDQTWLEPFTFHFCLNDYTIIAFAKPYKPRKPEEKLCDSICRKVKEGDLNKRQNLFFISDQENYVSKCFSIPFVTKRQLILSEQLLPSFLSHLTKRGFTLKSAVSSQTSLADEVKNSKNDLVHSLTRQSDVNSMGETPEQELDTKYDLKLTKKMEYRSIFKSRTLDVSSDLNSDLNESTETNENIANRNRKSFNAEDLQVLRKSNLQLLREIRTAVESQIPVFKICSSKLHRFQYVRRVKSYIEIPVGPILKRIVAKPFIQQTSRNVYVSKLIPIKPLLIRNYPKYEMQLCLPSGLHVECVAGFDNDPFSIRQAYKDKGPQCKNVAHEVSRTYIRNGSLLIKKTDGNYDIFSANGQIVNCTLPNYRDRTSKPDTEPAKNLRKSYSLSNLTYLHAYGTNSTRFKRYFQRVMHRLDKRTIGKPATKTFTSYTKCKSRKIAVSPDIVYLLQSTVAPFTKFSLITSDGKKLNVTKKGVMKEKKFDSGITNEYRYEELLFDREDGTRMLFNRESELFVQFPDGTRISSWIQVEHDLINVLEVEPRCCNGKCNAEEQTSLHENESFSEIFPSTPHSKSEREVNGWVSITLNFKFEHPNYGTVIFYGASQNAELILPGNLNINISQEGEYNLDISNKISATITTSTLTFESQLCSTCSQKCVAILNIKPLYDKTKNVIRSNKLQFIQVTDSFNKKFVVNFNGECYSNTDYIRGRFNSVHCPNHNIFEHNKLFILRRNLNGCKLWDVNAYRNNIKTMKNQGNTVIKFHDKKTFQKFFSTTLTTKVYKPEDEKYLLPYKDPYLTLTKYKTVTTESLKHLYTMQQDLKLLPELAKILSIYSAVFKLRERNGTSEIIRDDLNTFIVNLLHQSDEEVRAIKDQQEKLEYELYVASNLVPPISIAERMLKWKEEVNLYLSKIRTKCVPLYDASEHMKTLMGESLAPDTNLNELIQNEDNDICENMIDIPEVNVSDDSKTVDIENTLEELVIIDEDNDNTSSIVNLEIESSSDIKIYEPRQKTIKDELLQIPLAVKILHKLVLHFGNVLNNDDLDYEPSESKVLCVAEKIYYNIMKSVKDLNEVPKEDLINVVSKLLFNNVCIEDLNAEEMHLLKEHLTKSEEQDICKSMFKNTEMECLDYYKLTKPNIFETEPRPSALPSYIDSAYQLYSLYRHKNDIIRSETQITTSTIPRKRSVQVVYRTLNENDDSAENVTHEKNKYLLRTSYTNLIQTYKDDDFCEHCIDKSEMLKEREVSKDESSDLSVDIGSDIDLSFSNDSNDLISQISPESNVLDSANDDIETVDSQTQLLQKYNFITPESMRVLFSIASLKGKHIDNAGPFVERPPGLIENSLIKTTEDVHVKDTLPLDDYGAQDICSICTKKNPSSSVNIKKTDGYPSLVAMLQNNKYRNFQVSKYEEGGFDIDPISNTVGKTKVYKSHVIAKVGNSDMEYLKKGCPPTLDPALRVKEFIKRRPGKVIRKTVGMVTQPGTNDHDTQT